MQYAKGSIGRVFLLKFSDDDILVQELIKFAKKERLKSAALIFLGALKKGDLVTGPKKPVIPPKPNWVKFKNGWEVAGTGTIFTNKSGPQVHIHVSMGKKKKVLTGCVRKDSRVFLVIEAVVFELKGVNASKEIDPKTGLNLLMIR
ncbi:MAG: DNA-binding protein [Candidatus Omnitrophica bacterium]|nr:DNA-binding protein [Candidatus Omnitrophota bacterium]